ncbi:MAG: hypothetical protein FJW20_11300 [Acidimicrobiia bacterium]|nr:hypothetical protein [Acidimicrobiia bacterium]
MLMRMARVLLFLLVTVAAGRDLPEIRRDDYGVPHIYGKTDASVVMGLMYAQAEDNFWQLEQDVIRALGRSGGVNDVLVHAFEIPRLAREEYAAMEAASKAICDAWAEGLNLYLKMHPAVRPALIDRFEPWHILAMHRGTTGVIGKEGVTLEEARRMFPKVEGEASNDEEGSNMWAIGPERSATGRAMLFINPHIRFFGGGQRYEAHLDSRQGLKVSGFAILGTPYIRSGFTERHGWSHTNNNADMVDTWLVEPDDPSITSWTDGGVTYRKSRQGVLLGMRDRKYVAVRSARVERRGVLEQRVAMARARSLAEFKTAMARRALTGSNTMYADREGNIFYVHGNAIPRRVEGDWRGWHEMEELPQYTNPKSGYLQNCNSTPFLAAGENGGLEESNYPAYMVPERDNLRAEMSRRLLEREKKFTFEDWGKAALDTYVLRAEKELPELLSAWEELKKNDAGRAAKLADVMKELAGWNRVSTVTSAPMTLYMKWSALREKAGAMEALEQVKAQLEKDFGTWRVAWGEVNRLQRIHTSGTQERFDEARLSAPVAGGPGAAGVIFNFTTRTQAGDKRGYGISGNTYVAVVEFGKKVWAGSVLVFGQSADVTSPHYFDQRDLYASKGFKIAWFYEGDVKKSTARTYRPGDPD